MDQVLAEVITLLELERLEDNIFRGESRDIGSPQVFGGQVLGQAVCGEFLICRIDSRDFQVLSPSS